MLILSPQEWQSLSPWLDEALELGEGERDAWLASRRARDPEMTDRLEMLLEEHRALSEKGFLEQSVGLTGGLGLAGQTFGVYTAISQIGQGGMGSVWLAERCDGRFERRVAVKALNIALIGSGGEERFKREGSILGRLSHPHIAELYDAGVSPAGQPYLVLEHVDGAHIDEYCDKRRLTVKARARLFLDVLEAVAHAHANRIVHRDIKPSNVLVTTGGEVKLLDFGIAKLMRDEGNGAASLLTREAGAAMTPEYAAPEQVNGGEMTSATDVYALGVLLYALLTGQQPTGAGPHSAASLVKSIVETEPPRMSQVAALRGGELDGAVLNATIRGTTPGKLSRLLRGDLDTIVIKALKKNPEERYATAQAFADDLRRYLQHEPIAARPEGIVSRAVKFLRRHRRALIAGPVTGLALTGMMTAAWLRFRPEALPQLQQRRLTANPQDAPVRSSAMSPDARYLGYSDEQGIHLQVVETGAAQSVTLPSAGDGAANTVWTFLSWYPDSKRFLVSGAAAGGPIGLWSVAIQGDGARKIADVEDMGQRALLSPDGAHIAYLRRRSAIGAREIWLMDSNGEMPRRIVTADSESTLGDIGWSPSGKRIVYSYAWRGRGQGPSVQSCDLSGAGTTTIFRDYGVSALIWISPGRLIFSRRADHNATESDNLSEIRVDENSGLPQGAVRRLTGWSGFSIDLITAAADGKHLAFRRTMEHLSVFTGDVASNGSYFVSGEKLVTDDNLDIALAWTPDSREVFFSSQKQANRLIYKQGLEAGSVPQLITAGSGVNFYLARVSPDGTSLVLEGEPDAARGKMAIYQVGLGGGVPGMLFPLDGMVLFGCAGRAAGFCVVERPKAGGNELVTAAFDPRSGGSGKELLRVPLEPGSSAEVGFDYGWAISPDGAEIAVLKRHSNQIRVTPVNGAPARVIAVKGYSDIQDVSWGTDSPGSLMATAMLRPGRSTLLRVDFGGNARPVWRGPQAEPTGPVMSPDGRHLAISAESYEANVWMVENF
jgi:serine/threonine protein kinase/Tol biopolymer transport system component